MSHPRQEETIPWFSSGGQAGASPGGRGENVCVCVRFLWNYNADLMCLADRASPWRWSTRVPAVPSWRTANTSTAGADCLQQQSSRRESAQSHGKHEHKQNAAVTTFGHPLVAWDCVYEGHLQTNSHLQMCRYHSKLASIFNRTQGSPEVGG